MLFQSLHDTEWYPLGLNPDTIKNADIDCIFNMGEDLLKCQVMVLERQDDTIDTKIQRSSHAIFKV